MAKDRTRPGTSGDEASDEPAGTGAIPDVVRRLMAVGLSGLFTTEEALRRALGDNIPQDWVDFAAGQSERTRRDFSDAVAKEVGRVLEQVDLAELFGQIFENRTVEIRARVRLMASEEAQVERVSIEFDDPESA